MTTMSGVIAISTGTIYHSTDEIIMTMFIIISVSVIGSSTASSGGGGGGPAVGHPEAGPVITVLSAA